MDAARPPRVATAGRCLRPSKRHLLSGKPRSLFGTRQSWMTRKSPSFLGTASTGVMNTGSPSMSLFHTRTACIRSSFFTPPSNACCDSPCCGLVGSSTGVRSGGDTWHEALCPMSTDSAINVPKTKVRSILRNTYRYLIARREIAKSKDEKRNEERWVTPLSIQSYLLHVHVRNHYIHASCLRNSWHYSLIGHCQPGRGGSRSLVASFIAGP